jgi:hypothetical protein
MSYMELDDYATDFMRWSYDHSNDISNILREKMEERKKSGKGTYAQ